jgi:hypothetical protein
MTFKADKQVLRSRAFRALAQDASPHVIPSLRSGQALSAEGAKDLLLMTDNR